MLSEVQPGRSILSTGTTAAAAFIELDLDLWLVKRSGAVAGRGQEKFILELGVVEVEGRGARSLMRWRVMPGYSGDYLQIKIDERAVVEQYRAEE